MTPAITIIDETLLISPTWSGVCSLTFPSLVAVAEIPVGLGTGICVAFIDTFAADLVAVGDMRGIAVGDVTGSKVGRGVGSGADVGSDMGGEGVGRGVDVGNGVGFGVGVGQRKSTPHALFA